MRIEHDLPYGTTDDVIDMVAKSLLLRAGGNSILVTWADLERASKTRCEVVRTEDGVIFRPVHDVRN
jgi:hypothetical protein